MTGITDEMVAGRSIDPEAVEAFIADAAIVTDRNPRFDRPIAENDWPVFKGVDWACSQDEIPWRENGFEGTKLAYLLMGAGLFAAAHRGSGDCCALLHILSSPFGAEGKPALATLLANARQATVRIFAIDSPFERKDLLKGRGYRWSSGTNVRIRRRPRRFRLARVCDQRDSLRVLIRSTRLSTPKSVKAKAPSSSSRS